MAIISFIFDTPGIGGLVACTVLGSLVITYGLTIRWIVKGRDEKPKA